MIKILLTIEEIESGVINYKGEGGHFNKSATDLEIRFAEEVMIAIQRRSETEFKLTESGIPLTFISRKVKPKDEHTNRN
jgi:hypothetical protein